MVEILVHPCELVVWCQERSSSIEERAKVEAFDPSPQQQTSTIGLRSSLLFTQFVIHPIQSSGIPAVAALDSQHAPRSSGFRPAPLRPQMIGNSISRSHLDSVAASARIGEEETQLFVDQVRWQRCFLRESNRATASACSNPHSNAQIPETLQA